MGRRPKLATLVVAVTVLVFAACSKGGGDEAVTAAPATASPTTAPPATLPPAITTTPTTTTAPSTTSTATATTTTAPPTTTTPPTTQAPTTTAVVLPQPIAPPQDAYTDEGTVVVGTISIPAIGVERTMYEGIRIPTLDRGPGHWPGTAMPGERGNVVVAGHRVSKNQDFRDLDQLVAGDEVIFTTDQRGPVTYLVDRIEIVEPEALWIVDQTPEPTATLFACHPPGSVAQRIVAHLTLAA